MDLGLDQPGALDRLFVVLHDIERIDERVTVFFDDPSGLHREDNGIGELVADHEDPHVDIRRTMLAALGGLRGSLTTVRTHVTSVPTTPEVLATLCRTALLASCRLLVLVGPLDIEDRKRNTVRVMLQESSGLYWVYKRAQDFKELTGLIPPPELLAKYKERHDKLWGANRPKPFSEIEVVELASDIISERLRALGEGTEREYVALSEQLIWVFNTYSGIAHAFAWPMMVPGATDRLPGDFVSDLGTTVEVTKMAIESFEEATG